MFMLTNEAIADRLIACHHAEHVVSVLRSFEYRYHANYALLKGIRASLIVRHDAATTDPSRAWISSVGTVVQAEMDR